MIYLGSDHGGFLIKKSIGIYLQKNSIEYKDFGSYDENEILDYPNIAKTVTINSIKNNSFGIIICGSGIGVSIVANKIKGARAALCTNVLYAKLAREHNDANILCLGGRIINEKEACEIVRIFINTKFEGGRHATRIKYISDIENLCL